MDECMYVCMHVCMYVCMYVHRLCNLKKTLEEMQRLCKAMYVKNSYACVCTYMYKYVKYVRFVYIGSMYVCMFVHMYLCCLCCCFHN